MMRPALILVAVMMLAVPARGEWVSATAERIFSAEQSEAEACRTAEDKAREDAVRQVTGERLSSEELMRCSEQGEQVDCAHNSAIWSTVDGEIRGVRNRRSETVAVLEGFHKCVVALEADVVVPPGRPDPSFDIGIRLNASVFRDGEALEITLSPSRPMGVAVFQWLPYEQGDAQVSRVLPNPFDPVDRIERATTIPTETGRKRYTMRVGFPTALPSPRRMVDEYLMVVATRRPVQFREAYSLDDFRARLLELPRGDSRIVRKAYSVIRGGP
ncbi:MAG: DUF4384 domain-containing protein [Magnetospirillum sp.]|nr:MAG: DUF4384 domain-containing protein [Magnetospirillum sp.]